MLTNLSRSFSTSKKRLKNLKAAAMKRGKLVNLPQVPQVQVGPAERIAVQTELPVKLSPELQATMQKMQQRVVDAVQHMEGIKTAVVLYLLNSMGVNLNRRQMRRVTRSVTRNVIQDVLNVERFEYMGKHLCTFDTITATPGNFELRFKEGFDLTAAQLADVQKLLEYKHPSLSE